MSTEIEISEVDKKAEARIDTILKNAEEVIFNKLKVANRLIDDIKKQLVHGTDTITTIQIQEWAVVIPIISQELTPSKEAYALTKKLVGY